MDEYDKHIQATQAILDDKFKKGTIQNMYIGEVLEGLSVIPAFPERVQALKNNSDRSLNTILQVTFKNDRPRLSGKDIESIEYRPTFSDDDVSIAPMNLYDTAKRLYVFYRDDLTTDQMKKIAFEILSNLHPSEAELFKGIFAGKMPVKNITKNLVETAFPDLFDGEGEKEDGRKNETKEAKEKADVDAKKIYLAKEALEEEIEEKE